MSRRPCVAILLLALAVQTVAGGRALDGFVLCLGGQHADEPAAGLVETGCSADCDHHQSAPALRTTHEHECPCIDIALVCIAVRVDLRRDAVAGADGAPAAVPDTMGTTLAPPHVPPPPVRGVDRVDRAGAHRLAVVRSTRLLV